MKRKVLIAEDETLMADVLGDYFKSGGYETACIKNGLDVLDAFDREEFDLILLDVMLPELDGFSICRYIRKTSDVPIIMITARCDEEDKLAGYEAGADDYVTKPFSPRVLTAKADALLRRTGGRVCGDKIVSAAGIVINDTAHTVTADGESIDLTPKEYELLLNFMQNIGVVFTRDALLTKIWGYDYFGDLRTVDTHIKKLRTKLGEKAVHIKTLIKAGYKFEE